MPWRTGGIASPFLASALDTGNPKGQKNLRIQINGKFDDKNSANENKLKISL
jgi:hypothetical protein